MSGLVPTCSDAFRYVPMFLEAGFFRRPKQGIYQFDKTNQPYHEVTLKIYIESFKVNQPLSLTYIDELNPYFQFITFEKI